jgi:hypothetical protein
MLSDLNKTIDAYFTTYGALLGERAVEANPPLYRAGIDRSVDLSFTSHQDPRRVPYAAQANVINALVRSWTTREWLDFGRRARKSSKVICGEMGTGKTLLGAAGIHAHATACGLTGYRVLIMCPDHLVDKWEREILETVPGAAVYKFTKSKKSGHDDSFRQVAAYIDWCRGEDKGRIGPKRWRKADRPEFVIVSQIQVKSDPGWQGLGERRFVHTAGVINTKIVGHEDVLDDQGRPMYDEKGKKRRRAITAKVPCCPRCGQVIRQPIDELWDKQAQCPTLLLREVGDADRRTAGDNLASQGLDVLCPIPGDCPDVKADETVKYRDRTYRAEECGERLWQWVPQPRKWAPANLLHKHARKLFGYFVLDEMHEEKEAESAQGIASGKLMKTAKRVLGLTGTLIAGKAADLFPSLFRMCPRPLVEEGFEWNGATEFSKVYGVIETTITTKFGKTKSKPAANTARGKGQTSMRKEASDESRTVKKDVKPGVMPTFFGKHLLDKAIFISLSEMEDDLPELIDDDRSLIGVTMGDGLADAYQELEDELVETNKRLLQVGCNRLLSPMLHTLLEYPDKPFHWVPPYPGLETIGYHGAEGGKCRENWNGVVTPRELAESQLQAKEQELYDLVMREAGEGRQCWVYCLQTGIRDVQSRLQGILQRGGLKVKVLRRDTAKPRDREAWIAKHGPNVHVMISNPVLVATGLDFFDRAGTFNFCTIIFYQGDYRVNLIRQAGRRHWRIGQPKQCRTYYLYYRNTMQERQVMHVGDKFAAARSLEGKFSAEGLAALSGDGPAMTEMARAIEAKIGDPRAAWARLRKDRKEQLVKLHAVGALNLDFVLDDDDFALLDEIRPEDLVLTDDDFALLDEIGDDLDILVA